MELFNYLFNFVILTCKLFNIDESHAVKHSMDVFYFSNKIYDSELPNNPHLQNQKRIIDTAAILHDMCDKKYVNEDIGIERIYNYMYGKLSIDELKASLDIMQTMSYSTTKKNGFPNLGEYQLAYNIVREADLLASYDFERCMIYQMMKKNENYEKSFNDAKELFEVRMFKYNDDNLFTTKYAKDLSFKMHNNALKRIKTLNNIFKI